MNDLVFYSWDYDQDEVIQWQRQGECNQCGECCTATIRFKVADKRFSRVEIDGGPTEKSGGSSTDREGLWHSVTRGNLTRFFKIIEQDEIGSHFCRALLGNNRCAVQSKKSLFNKVWPMHPNQVTPYPNCSFKFGEVARWTLVEEK